MRLLTPDKPRQLALIRPSRLHPLLHGWVGPLFS